MASAAANSQLYEANCSAAGNAEAAVEFVEEEAAAGGIGLEPLAVDDELGDGALAYVADDFGRGGGIGVNVDFGVRNTVGIEELLGGAAVAAPPGGINLDLHPVIVLRGCGWYM